MLTCCSFTFDNTLIATGTLYIYFFYESCNSIWCIYLENVICFISSVFSGTLDKALIIWDLRKNEDEFETFALNRLTTKRDNIVRRLKFIVEELSRTLLLFILPILGFAFLL